MKRFSLIICAALVSGALSAQEPIMSWSFDGEPAHQSCTNNKRKSFHLFHFLIQTKIYFLLHSERVPVKIGNIIHIHVKI